MDLNLLNKLLTVHTLSLEEAYGPIKFLTTKGEADEYLQVLINRYRTFYYPEASSEVILEVIKDNIKYYAYSFLNHETRQRIMQLFGYDPTLEKPTKAQVSKTLWDWIKSDE